MRWVCAEIFSLEVWVHRNITTGNELSSEMLWPLPPHRCVILRGLKFFHLWRVWQTCLCPQGGVRICPHTIDIHHMGTHDCSARLSLVQIKNKVRSRFNCLLPRHKSFAAERQLNVLFLHQSTKTTCSSLLCCTQQENTRLRWSCAPQTSRNPGESPGVSKLHLIGWLTEAHVTVSWFNQNNTSEHINLY